VFETELFASKVGSIAESIAGLELHCMSGLQFWEDSDESLLMGLDQEDEEDENEETEGMTEGEKHNYFLQKMQKTAIKNKLSNQVADKMAEDKRIKRQLF